MRRRLTAQEQALWERVAATITPLEPLRPKTPAEALPKAMVPAPPTPRPKGRVPAPLPPPR